MPKTKEQMLKVRVNPGSERDEVFITSDTSEKSTDPYVNKTVYAKPGLFKDGEYAADVIAKMEERSVKALADEHAEKLAQEAKEREAAAKMEAPKEG